MILVSRIKRLDALVCLVLVSFDRRVSDERRLTTFWGYPWVGRVGFREDDYGRQVSIARTKGESK